MSVFCSERADEEEMNTAGTACNSEHSEGERTVERTFLLAAVHLCTAARDILMLAYSKQHSFSFTV